MLRGAVPCVSHLDLSWVGLRQRQKLGNASYPDGRVNLYDQRHPRDAGYWSNVAREVEVETPKQCCVNRVHWSAKKEC